MLNRFISNCGLSSHNRTTMKISKALEWMDIHHLLPVRWPFQSSVIQSPISLLDSVTSWMTTTSWYWSEKCCILWNHLLMIFLCWNLLRLKGYRCGFASGPDGPLPYGDPSQQGVDCSGCHWTYEWGQQSRSGLWWNPARPYMDRRRYVHHKKLPFFT